MFSGRLSVRRVMALVERLHDEPWSRYRARLIGGGNWREHLGWGPAEYLQAVLIDAIQQNTAITAVAGSGKRPKKVPLFYRPARAAGSRAEDLKPDDMPLTDAQILEAAALLND